jgi:hypothetical protein
MNIEASVASQSECGILTKDCDWVVLALSTEKCEYNLLYLAGYPDLQNSRMSVMCSMGVTSMKLTTAAVYFSLYIGCLSMKHEIDVALNTLFCRSSLPLPFIFPQNLYQCLYG